MSKARDLANAGTALTTVSATELGYLDGVTSAVQTQIDSKIGSASAINPTIVDAKGDIIAATAADTVARLAVGANDTVLTADSSTATGLKWATPAGGAANYTLLNAGGTALTGSNTITVSGISGKDSLFIYVVSPSSAGTYENYQLRFNSDTNANYSYNGLVITANQTPTFFAYNDNNMYPIWMGGSTAASTGTNIFVKVDGANATGVKPISHSGVGASGGSSSENSITNGYYKGTSAITSVSINTVNGNFDNGTLYVYGA